MPKHLIKVYQDSIKFFKECKAEARNLVPNQDNFQDFQEPEYHLSPPPSAEVEVRRKKVSRPSESPLNSEGSTPLHKKRKISSVNKFINEKSSSVHEPMDFQGGFDEIEYGAENILFDSSNASNLSVITSSSNQRNRLKQLVDYIEL